MTVPNMPETPVATEVQPIDESRIPNDLAGFTKWRQTGELPPETAAPEVKAGERDDKGRFRPTKSEPAVQESAPADAPKETVEPVKATSDSGTEDAPQEQDRSVGKEAEKRIRQLLARVKELESKSDVKAESSPAADVTKAESSTAKPRLTRPQWSTWDKSAEEFDQASSAYEEQLRQDIENTVLTRVAVEQIQRDISATDKELPGFQKAVDTVVNGLAGPECAGIKQILGVGPQWKKVTHYLGQHPDLIENLATLAKTDPIEAVREAVRISDKALVKPADAKPAPEPKPRVTQAPPPPQPVSARATGAFDVNDETMNADEWAARRTAERKARGFAY